MKLTRQFTKIATGLLAIGLFVGPSLAAQSPVAGSASLVNPSQPVAAVTSNSTATVSSQAATAGTSVSSDDRSTAEASANPAVPTMHLPNDVKPIDPTLPIVIEPTPPGDPQPTPIDPIPAPTPPHHTPPIYACPMDGSGARYRLESDAQYPCPPVDLRQ